MTVDASLDAIADAAYQAGSVRTQTHIGTWLAEHGHRDLALVVLKLQLPSPPPSPTGTDDLPDAPDCTAIGA